MRVDHVRNLQKEESGAVLIVVALSLIVVFGMAVLVIDVGGLLLSRRGMVQAADSAALAAAQQCAKKQPGATAKADEYAQSNDVDATRVGELRFSGGCESSEGGSVTVEYLKGQDLYFAPVLGLGNKIDVNAEATAIWGSVQTAPLIPIVFNSPEGQTFPCAIEQATTTCSITFDNSDSPSNNNWGFLAIPDGWPVDAAGNSPTRNCPNANSGDLIDALNTTHELSLVGQPTWVCIMHGHHGAASGNNAVSDALLALDDDPDKVWNFPISDLTLLNGQPNSVVNSKIPMVGFAALKIKQVLLGKDAATFGTPAIPGGRTECPGMPILHEFDDDDDEFDITSYIQACSALGPVEEPPEIYREGSGRRFREGRDFDYDSVTDEIEWDEDEEDVEIFLYYDKPDVPATPGACEPPPNSPANSYCLVLETVGVSLDGGDPDPTGGTVGNIKAIRLCDPVIEPTICPAA
jgi:Putative Flp pilus-assembly TadE/G-like